MSALLASRRNRLILAGAGLVLAVLALKVLVLKGGSSQPITIVVPPHHVIAPKPAAGHAKAAVKIDPSLPAALRTALLKHPVVVAVIYAAHAPGDADALKAARAGAKNAHAGFAVIDVTRERIAQLTALKLPGTSDPSVVVVRRPGTVSLLLPGFVDSDAVTAAVLNAR